MSPADLLATELHPSTGDSSLTSLSFLNEVMSCYPEAISFAPGAPHVSFFENLDLHRCVDTYLQHLTAERRLTPARARKLLFEYGPSQGLINDLVAEALLRDHGVQADPGHVVITVGCQEAMLLAVRAVCASPGDLLAVVNPSFVGILGAARLLDVPVVPIAEGTSGVDLEQLARQCRAARSEGRRVRALYVAPDYANPSGTVMNMAARRELLTLAEREDLLVLEDTAYGFTAPVGQEMPPLKALDTERRVVLLGTFAKICLPGARVGFLVADQQVHDPGTGGRRTLARILAELKTMVTVNTSPIAQAVIGGLLLEHGRSLAAVGRRKAALYQRNLGLLLDSLDRHLPQRVPELTWNRPTGGFFVRIRLPIPADRALLARSAAEYGVLWTPMADFYLDGGGERELRLSCSYLNPDDIEEGVRRLSEFLGDVVRDKAPRTEPVLWPADPEKEPR